MSIRMLDWTVDPDGVDPAPDLRAARTLLLAHWCVQGWAWWLRPLPIPFTIPPACALALAFLLALALAATFTRWARTACRIALVPTLLACAWTLPGTPNHTLFAALLLALFAWLDTEEGEDAALLLRGLRWMVVIVFFYAGLQKVLHGLYFRGEFLAWMIGQGVDRWAAVFGWMLPAGELERLQSYPRYLVDAGPYRVASPFFLAVSNGVWIGELALAVGLCIRRLRIAAALGSIALVFSIQAAPREFMFALLYSQLLVIFLPAGWQRRLLPVYLAAYAWLFAALLGAPGQFLVRASGDI